MTDATPAATAGGPRRTVALLLAAIVVVGGVARATVAADPGTAEQSADERAYERIARSLAEDARYGAPGVGESLRWPPGAPFLFGAVARLDPSLAAAYWVQALIGTALIVVCFAIATVAAGPVAGLLAAGLVASYPPLIAFTGELLTEPLGALLVATGVLALTWGLRVERLRWVAAAGVLLAGAVLTRADLLLAPPLVAVALAGVLWRPAGRRTALRTGAVLTSAYLLALAPWVVFASATTGRLVPVTEGDGAALFVGTYLPGDGTTIGMKRRLAADTRARFPGLRDTRDIRLSAFSVLSVVAERHPQLRRSQALQLEARANLERYALGQPLAFARMMAGKVRRTWLVSSRLGVRRPSPLVRGYHAALVAGCLLALTAGVLLRRSPLLVVVAVLVAQNALVHAVFVAKPRYAVPLLALLFVAAVVAAVPAASAVLRRQPISIQGATGPSRRQLVERVRRALARA